MTAPLPPVGPAARLGFRVAILCAILGLASATVSPLAGLVLALIFFAVAWGIRRRRAWAAISAVCFLLAPLPIAATRVSRGDLIGFALAVVLELAFALVMARAAVELWRDPAGRSAWPWAPVAVVLALFWISVHPFAISAGSMENTLLRGDYVLVETLSWRLGRTPGIGDIVALRYPLDRRQQFIKRVVAGPGDRIRIRDKQLYRNGDPVPEPFAIHTASYTDPFRDNFPSAPTVQLAGVAEDMLRYDVQNGELLVPDGKYFVLGDNRDDSLDSRYWGFISVSDIVGSPVVVYASYNPVAGKPAISFRETRWNRLGKLLR